MVHAPPMAHAAVAEIPSAAALLHPIAFSEVAGWNEDDHAAAFRAFRAGGVSVQSPPKTRGLGVSGKALFQVLQAALRAGELDRLASRRFFEHWFVPHRIAADGFVTGYFEPEVAASLTRTDRFTVPLYRRPPDLAELPEDERPSGWDPEIRFARRTSAGWEPYFDRAAIENGALAGQNLELAWLQDPVDAFFIHVQGSARLRLHGGGTMRVGFDGKSGRPYTSIGRLAVDRGLLSLEAATKDGLESWLKARPEAGRALMQENRSFIFFRETDQAEADGPLGAAGVPLSAGRSLAVDRTLHTFHSPVWVDAPDLPDPDSADLRYRRLMIAQDTGSAIVGPARGDLFFGSGAAAGLLAGRVRHRAQMVVFVPRQRRVSQ